MARAYINPGPLKYTAKVKRDGNANNSWSWVEFPYDLKETFGVGNLVPVNITFDGRVKYRGSLAKMGPAVQIVFRKDVQAELGKEAGDSVEVIVELDDKPREVVIPADAKEALKEAGLLENFEKMAYTHRKEYVRWVEEAKKPETRANRIQKMCSMLAEGKKLS